MQPPFLGSSTTQQACLTCWSIPSHWHVSLKLEEHQRSPTAMRRKSFCSGWAPWKSHVGPRWATLPTSCCRAPLLVSHSFAARHVGWTQPGGVDISEIQSYSCHKTRQPGDGDIPAMPHWRKGFAVSVQHNHKCPVPLNRGSAPTKHQRIRSSGICRKASFMSPAGLGRAEPSYAYTTWLIRN